MQDALFFSTGVLSQRKGFLQMVLARHLFLYIFFLLSYCAMFRESDCTVHIFDIDIDVINQIIVPHQFQPYSVDLIHLSYLGLYTQHTPKRTSPSILPPPNQLTQTGHPNHGTLLVY